ncbi:hypothetical protein EI94DRAFT_1772201 [Lactarius quietus]|nr:hypothetical protein EI94DRAFT_1772201 [Lactarius quietus]
MPTPFDSIPQEVLESIAFFVVASEQIGPPRELSTLMLVNKRMYASLSSAVNPSFHSRIFATKFDTAALVRRLGPRATTAPKLAAELRRRFVQLGRLRARVGCTVGALAVGSIGGGAGGGMTEQAMRALHEMIWTAYLMMLENDGLNERQLREYARLDGWLRSFWFEEDGASCAHLAIRDNAWPPNNDISAVTMWLFWFLLRPEVRNVTAILKLLALGAHEYPVCRPAWADFVPDHTVGRYAAPPAYAEYPSLSPPPLAAPAVLSYLTLDPRSPTNADALHPLSPVVPSSVLTQARVSSEWDCEWERCKRLAGNESLTPESPTGTFKPGSMEGIWEGLFTYTEFMAYVRLLTGAPPPTLNNSHVARHQQTWRLHEYHLLLPEDLDSAAAQAALTDPQYWPLSPGDPLRAYLPHGLAIQQDHSGIRVREPGHVVDTFYSRCPAPEDITPEYARRVREILIAGEGHSAWGQFASWTRPSVSLLCFWLATKPITFVPFIVSVQIDGDRGKWLYRGYFVGDVHGNFTGRWRDTLSPAEVLGYEGCFFMGRRR